MDDNKMFYVGLPDTDLDHIADNGDINMSSSNDINDTSTLEIIHTTQVDGSNLEDIDSDRTSGDENKERGNWTGKLDFLLSCLSFAVGLGNVWRFPYQCYKNGGGAFLIPYVSTLFICGIPLFFLETAFGQFASLGVVSIWKVSPIFTGIGYAMFLVSFFVAIYYNVLIAWSFFYLFASFTKELPWGSCNNDWNSPACGLVSKLDEKNCIAKQGVYMNHSCLTNYTADDISNITIKFLTNGTSSNETDLALGKSPSDEYFHNYVLDISEGFHDLGEVRWQLAMCLLLAWVVVCLCMIKGFKTSGKAVYFTATFPYLVLTILLVRGVTLPGSIDGVYYFFSPEWEKLKSPKVWCDATVQIFYTLAPGWGGLISLSSYNKFHNNCMRDAFIVGIGAVLTSVFAGIVIFSIIGYMAQEVGLPVSEVVDEGAGLAFIVYPQVVTRLPVSPLWSILFFLMLLTLGLGTQFAIINTVHTTLLDMYPEKLRLGRRPSYLMIALGAAFFFMGLSCCTQGGMYVLQLLDSYAATYSVLLIGLSECIALTWVYGYDNLSADIKLMLGKKIGIGWKIIWQFVCPALLAGLIFFTWFDFKPTSYGGYDFPVAAEVIGFLVTFASILCIPGVAIYYVCTKHTNLSVLERIKKLSKPTSDWGPALAQNKDPNAVHMTANESQIPLQLKVENGPLSPTESTLRV